MSPIMRCIFCSTWIMSNGFRPEYEQRKSPERGITFAMGLLLVAAVGLGVWLFAQHVGMSDQFQFIRSLGN